MNALAQRIGFSRDSARLVNAQVVVLGMLPPPVTGAAKNTLLMLEELANRGVAVAGVNTGIATTALTRSLRYHARRMAHTLGTAWRLGAMGAASTGKPMLYCVPDGGAGLYYTALHLARARTRSRHVVLHHRSFGYIDKASGAMRSICAANRGRLTHVFLSPGMREAFFAKYEDAESLVSTNACYVSPREVPKCGDVLVIGHLSNLCGNKGFFEVADTFEQLRNRGLPARLELAGSIMEDAVRERLDRLQAEHDGLVTYHGPLQGQAKDDFYDRLHVFLFPTKWKQEAQPNVVYEAFAGGSAAIAFDRGCIAEMIPRELGIAIGRDGDFVHDAANWIERFWNGSDRTSLTGRIFQHIDAQCRQSRQQHEALLDRITS